MADFSCEKIVSAVRKEHRCYVCLTNIEVGETATRWSGTTDGDFHTAIMHPECLAAEREFNRDTMRGEWYALAYDRTTDDDLWLANDFPKVAERLGVVRWSA